MKKSKPYIYCLSPLGGECGSGCDLHCLFKIRGNIRKLLEIAGVKFNAIRHQRFSEGELIYRHNDTLDYVVSVHKGLVKLEETGYEGNLRILSLAGAGYVIGLSALIAEPMRHNAIAVHDTEICKIPVVLLNGLYYERPELFMDLMHCWQANLDLVDQSLVKFNSGNLTLRLVNLIIFLINQQVDAKSINTVRLLNLTDTASLLGVSRETVCRELAKLRNSGLITKLRRNEFFYDYEKLQSIAFLA